MSLPSPWDKIVEHNLLKFLIGPCPKCSAEATKPEQLVWPTLLFTKYNLYVMHCSVCHVAGVPMTAYYALNTTDKNTTLEEVVYSAPVYAVLDWNKRYWSGSPYLFTDIPESPHSVMVEALERTARNWTNNLGLTVTTAEEHEAELHAMILQWLADRRGAKLPGPYFVPCEGLPAVYNVPGPHLAEKARQYVQTALSSFGIPEKYVGPNTYRFNEISPNTTNIPKEKPTLRTEISKPRGELHNGYLVDEELHLTSSQTEAPNRPWSMAVDFKLSEQAQKALQEPGVWENLTVGDSAKGTNTGRVAKTLAYETDLQKQLARVRYGEEDKSMTTKPALGVRVFIEGVAVTEHLVGDAEWLSTSPTRKFSLKRDAFILSATNVCQDRTMWEEKEEFAKRVLYERKMEQGKYLSPGCPVIAPGDSLAIYGQSEPNANNTSYSMLIFTGRISSLADDHGGRLDVEGRSYVADIQVATQGVDLQKDLEYLRTVNFDFNPEKVLEALGKDCGRLYTAYKNLYPNAGAAGAPAGREGSNFSARVHEAAALSRDRATRDAYNTTKKSKETTMNEKIPYSMGSVVNAEYFRRALSPAGVAATYDHALSPAEVVADYNRVQESIARSLPRPTGSVEHSKRQFTHDGKLLLEMPETGDDFLILHLPNPISGKTEPALRLRRTGEVETALGWSRRMGELALQFWRAISQVHRTLPPPCSAKQEAIIAFCTEHKMNLGEFDHQYYAKPVYHGEVVESNIQVYPGTGQEPYSWGIWPIEPWSKEKEHVGDIKLTTNHYVKPGTCV